MTAEEAINLYKSRDVSEKLFRGDKSYMGAWAERVYGNVSLVTLGSDPFTLYTYGGRFHEEFLQLEAFVFRTSKDKSD